MKRAFLLAALCCGVLGCSGSKAPAQPVVDDDGEAAAMAAVLAKYGGADSLAQGERVLALLSVSCGVCVEAVPALNALREALPALSMTGLCLAAEDEEYRAFVSKTAASFELLRIEPVDFFVLADATPPVVLHVRDGRCVGRWEGVPTAEEFLAAN